MDAINLLEKAGLVDALWSPRVVGELNDVQVKVARIHGDFVWHDHQHTDELFLVVKGSMRVEYRDRAVTLNEGEMHIVPKRVEHRTAADEECWCVIMEPRGVVNTGEAGGELTAPNDVWV